MVKKVIGISGVARAGKDTFASILIEQLTKKGKTVSKYALADALKKDCDSFCIEKLGFSAYTQKPEEKIVIRPFLVWYGDAQRKRTNGTYWRDIVESKLEEDKSDYAVITDIRYSFYEKDEIQWIKEDCHGVVVHISRFSIDENANKIFVQPPNDHEAVNDPKVKALADYKVIWEHIKDNDLLHSPYLIGHVDEFIKFAQL